MSLNFLDLHSEQGQILRKPAATVEFPLSTEIQQLIADMKVKVVSDEGVGLAASQVGFHLQLLVYHVPEDLLPYLKDETQQAHPLSVLINGSYTPIPESGMENDWEACFSVPNYMGKVPRFKKIKFQGYSETGEKIEGQAHGYLARVIQHEIDHTQGILFTDLLTPNCLQGTPEKMRPIRMQEYQEFLSTQSKK